MNLTGELFADRVLEVMPGTAAELAERAGVDEGTVSSALHWLDEHARVDYDIRTLDRASCSIELVWRPRRAGEAHWSDYD